MSRRRRPPDSRTTAWSISALPAATMLAPQASVTARRAKSPSGRGDTDNWPARARQRVFHGFTQLHRDISLIRKPTIAMINGAAVGSGMDMALHCDVRVGCEKTRFIAYHNAGQIIENGGSYYLT